MPDRAPKNPTSSQRLSGLGWPVNRASNDDGLKNTASQCLSSVTRSDREAREQLPDLAYVNVPIRDTLASTQGAAPHPTEPDCNLPMRFWVASPARLDIQALQLYRCTDSNTFASPLVRLHSQTLVMRVPATILSYAYPCRPYF